MVTLKVIFLLLLCYLRKGLCLASYNDSQTLRNDLLANYDVNIRPVGNQSIPVYVSIQVYMASIKEFDEIQERISYIGSMSVTWYDINMVWDPAQYGGVNDTLVTYNSVWSPQLFLMTPAETIEPLFKNWSKIRFYPDGRADLMPLVLIDSTCSVNVRMFPFDVQTCRSLFIALDYSASEVFLNPMSKDISLQMYQENLFWEIKETKVLQISIGFQSAIEFVLVLERKPTFVVVNVILPILALSLLNVMVFVLIPESGERVSYSVTVLLSIAVFMTIVSDMLPRSSDPVPLISYKLMVDMVLSALIVVVTVINLKWYHIEDSVPVPSWLRSVHRVLTCSCSKPCTVLASSITIKKINVQPEDQNENKHEIDSSAVNHSKDTLEERNSKLANDKDQTKRVTWRIVSGLVDRIALGLFLAASICNVIVFLVVTGAEPS